MAHPGQLGLLEVQQRKFCRKADLSVINADQDYPYESDGVSLLAFSQNHLWVASFWSGTLSLVDFL